MDNNPSFMNVAAIPILPVRLHWSNLIAFQRCLMDYTASRSTAVGTSLTGGFDFEPPPDLPHNATNAEIKNFERTERAYNQYREHRVSICATLYQSLSNDIQNRVNQDPRALAHKNNGEAGSLWRFIRGIIQGVGYSDAMTNFTNLYQFRIDNPDNLVTAYTNFIDNISAIESRYPTEQDKSRLWQDFKTHRFVQALKDHDEFRDYLNQKVLTERVWPDHSVIEAELIRLRDAKRRIYQDPNLESNVNAVQSSGPCFNCKGNHWSKDCKKELTTCYKCGKRGHLQEFCDQISSYSRDDRRENKKSYDRYQHNSKVNSKTINRNTQDVHQKSKRGTKTTSHFRRTKNTRPRKFLARLADSNEDDEPMLVRAYLSELLNTQGEVIEYWEDALCCSADLQLTFDSYDPYQDEVEIPKEDMEEWNEDRESFYSTFNQPDSRSVSFNNDLYPYRDNESSVYFKMESSDRSRYPARVSTASSYDSENESGMYQSISRTFTRADQYGIPSPQSEYAKPFVTSKTFSTRTQESTSKPSIYQSRQEDERQRVHYFNEQTREDQPQTSFSRFSEPTNRTNQWNSRQALEQNNFTSHYSTPKEIHHFYPSEEESSELRTSNHPFSRLNSNREFQKNRNPYLTEYDFASMGLQDRPTRSQSESWMTSLQKSNDNFNKPTFHVAETNKFGSFATPAQDSNKQKLSLATLRARVEEQTRNEEAQQENFISPKPTNTNAVPTTNTPFSPRKLVSSDARNFQSPEPITHLADNKVATSQPDSDSISVTSEMTPDNSVIRQIPKRNTRPKQAQDKSVNNEEGDGNTKDTDGTTVCMAWTHHVQDNKAQFIIDTGCLGSHIFKNTDLLTRVHKSNVPVRDFSGMAHSTHLRGYLCYTNQQVLVMPDSKVNLLSSEQIFKDGLATTAMCNEKVFTFLDDNHNHILRAHSNGKGAYICSAEDLVAAFGNHQPIRVHSHWADAPRNLNSSLEVRAFMVEDEEPWTTPTEEVFLTAQQQDRAKEARELHHTIGHPSDKALCTALNNGNLIPTRLTCQDIRNAKLLLGPCIPCLQAKMKAPSEKSSDSPPAEKIGDNVHVDIIPVPTSVGGNNFILMTVDEKSDFIIGIPIPSKSTLQLIKATDVIIGMYHQRDHTLSHISSDNEHNLRAMEIQLRTRKISISTTPAGLHEKKSERSIQTVKRKLAATKAALSYVLPPILEAEAYITVIRLCNIVPTTNTGTLTPYEIFTKEKPKIPAYAFGTLAVAHHPRSDDKSIRAEIGIFISHGYNLRYLKFWIPTRHQMYSMRSMIPLKSQVTPISWNYKQNVRGILPDPNISNEKTSTLPATEVPIRPNLENNSIQGCSSIPQVSPTLNDQENSKNQEISHLTSRDNAFTVDENRLRFPWLNQEGAPSKGPESNQEGEFIDKSPVKQLSTTIPVSYPRQLITSAPQPSVISKSRDIAIPKIQSPTIIQSHVKGEPKKIYQDNIKPVNPYSDIVAAAPTQKSRSVGTHTQINLNTTKSGREIKPNLRYGYQAYQDSTEAYAANLKKLLQIEDRKEAIRSAINDEIENLMAPGIMEPIPIHLIRFEHRADIINLWLFHKEKFDSDGKFLKDKCRIVTLSQVRDTSKIGQTYSPTVNPISLFILLAKAATLPYYFISAYDVKGAFLNSAIPEDIYVYVRVDPELSKLFLEKYPRLKTYVNPNGTLTFRLLRYLYGLQESPLAWNKVLHQKLNQMKFKRSIADPCAYTREHKDGPLYLTVHVDDMLLVSPSDTARLWFEKDMESQFEITKQVNELSYLGMMIKKTRSGITVHQRGYIDNMVTKFKADPNSKTTSPTSSDFLTYDENDDKIDVTKYLGIVMSLMFLARFTRADILMPVTYLATKSADPRQRDYNKAIKILNYVVLTKSRHLKFKVDSDLQLVAYSDASHMLHADAKGHGGIIITFGGTIVATKSFKMKLVTKSSTESELVAVEESVPYVLWILTLLNNLGLEVKKPVKLMQDNLSAIGIVNNGGSFNRSKHMVARHGFVKQHMDLGDVILQHCPGEVMPADMLTKPLDGTRLKKLSEIVNLTDT